LTHANRCIGPEHRALFEQQGFFILGGFADLAITKSMLEEAILLARAAGGNPLHEGALILAEANLRDREVAQLEEQVSKIFRLHRRGIFHEFIRSRRVLEVVESLLGSPIDCFLSQFIFKHPGAWGQPWHQDGLYFPFDRPDQVGLWLAITETTLENGTLHVLPGSHLEPVHDHIPDRRPGANYGYYEIVDHDMSASIPVLMRPGDLLVFHSRLMHCSTDNVTDGFRAAMVYHCGAHGTRDIGTKQSAVIDWMALPASESLVLSDSTSSAPGASV